MSMTITPALVPIVMNGQKRRSARLSGEVADGTEPPPKKSRGNSGETNATSTTKPSQERRKAKVYDEDVDGFTFSKKRTRSRKAPEPAAAQTGKDVPETGPAKQADCSDQPGSQQAKEKAPRKARRTLPPTPEREIPVRRSKRLSSDKMQSQVAPSRQPSVQNPSPLQKVVSTQFHRDQTPPPLTVGKRRKQDADGPKKATRIALHFDETPVARRNGGVGKSSAENRRSSTDMRGRRASSLMEEGKGNGLPHPEVPTAEFYQHISPGLTEPRRMRCLLGWCGTRALPPRSEENSGPETRARQTAFAIQEELSKELISNGRLSDWFSRDEVPRPVRRKKAHPRNIANAANAEKLGRELERLKRERTEWDEIVKAATIPSLGDIGKEELSSPIEPNLLIGPYKTSIGRIQPMSEETLASTARRLRERRSELQLQVDSYANGGHIVAMTRGKAQQAADDILSGAAEHLDAKDRRAQAKALEPYDVLRALGKVINAR
ncbi:hypothetical protein K470DRAFT_251722 [Piedraia hortae CBS 480.64]|uniref:Uncharacterized protein n=1 Tax=Piedraia hortae CBS 480.64 TaxID=1314780 RepID=A0A6A7BUN3_9PEZI|nr:hypothetical protein K470DRAFT_251722 [Piedraia hortae CBS 480.64]